MRYAGRGLLVLLVASLFRLVDSQRSQRAAPVPAQRWRAAGAGLAPVPAGMRAQFGLQFPLARTI